MRGKRKEAWNSGLFFKRKFITLLVATRPPSSKQPVYSPLESIFDSPQLSITVQRSRRRESRTVSSLTLQNTSALQAISRSKSFLFFPLGFGRPSATLARQSKYSVTWRHVLLNLCNWKCINTLVVFRCRNFPFLKSLFVTLTWFASQNFQMKYCKNILNYWTSVSYPVL